MKHSLFFFLSVSVSLWHSLAMGYQNNFEIAQQLHNPLGDIVSFPLELNYDHKIGLEQQGTRWTLNSKPHLPMDYDQHWLILTDLQLPVIHQEMVSTPPRAQTGLGDTWLSFLLSPKMHASPFSWGVGPIFYFPTGTDTILSRDRWAVGPKGAMAYESSAWMTGLIVYHLWSYSGNQLADAINETSIQPFAAYINDNAWRYSINSEATYDWVKNDWTAPVHLMVNKLIRWPVVTLDLGAGVRIWAAHSNTGPRDLGVRAVLSLVFERQTA